MISDKELDNVIYRYNERKYLAQVTLTQGATNEILELLQELKQRRTNCQFDSSLLTIANHYGEMQIVKLVEEMAELTHAIMKAIVAEDINTESVLQETADVEIMLRQLHLLRNPELVTRINKIKEFKIMRTLDRINLKKACDGI